MLVNLRDPCDHFCFAALCGGSQEDRGQSKRHILPLSAAPFFLSNSGWNDKDLAPWHCRSKYGCPRHTALMFDCGASYFTMWGNDGGAANAGSWLFDTYKGLLHIRNYYAYEYEVLDPIAVFEKVPTEIMPSYHWINAPVTAEEGAKTNPWTILQRIKQTDGNADVTIVKVDIDTPSVEAPLVDQIFTSNLESLIDEFYYEHHVASSRYD